jgi:curli biogenesis system outer membrane secretion channel CsgG
MIFRPLVKWLPGSALLCAAFMTAGCAQMQMGAQEAKTTATGSVGGANAQNANSQLEKCDRPLGTVAVVEDSTAPWYGILTGQYRLGSTVPVLKLLVQQSNCFVVVERGRAMGSMMQERQLEQSGELRSNSKFGRGQMASADYALSPSITFSNQDAGGLGATIGGILGPVGSFLGGNLKAKEASTLLTLVDNRSGVQVAAAEGSARNIDMGILGGLFGSGAWGTAGGYARTAEGKVIVAAFTDAYNGIVKAVRNYRAQEVKGGLGTGGHLKVQE